MRYVQELLDFEDLVLKEDEEVLLKRRFHGEITEEEYMQKTLEFARSRETAFLQQRQEMSVYIPRKSINIERRSHANYRR
ncbi:MULTISPECIES: hypothetical protein [Bacillus]|uniref:Uncharacterized protein n=1 Tax=Bacillus paralicheniformis TaxID=1648923 RepID=A0ABY3FZ32_9BACI|nr:MULTISPECIES: hypothetical protein [Bacillus]MCY8038497.1 hypothetical protein [Bacillus paralicheniformis]MCY8180540.1 hypothetical protein [Bacillus paralicheniformis]MDE1383887.1 hypothetical protein [Bacillus paralicheniformis]MEC2098046.1 hypothetical protein [Bacillus paralicheniformis]MEC2117752.1 hypothetical protein [Bacillus paralicheniformis]